MEIARQLYQLQEVDTELELAEKAVLELAGKIEASEELTAARARLVSDRLHLEDIKKQQRSLEIDAQEITPKLKRIEDELYSGRVRNQKELSALEHEADTLKTRLSKLETSELELMDKADKAVIKVSSSEKEFKAAEEAWERQKPELTAELALAKARLAEITEKRRKLASSIDPSAVTVYQSVRKARGKAVVPVEKGVCMGCRITVTVTELQKVRSGQLVRCGSCGRILYSA